MSVSRILPSILFLLPLHADVLIDSSHGNGGFLSAASSFNGSPDGWSASSGVWIDPGNSALNSTPFGPDVATDSRFPPDW